MKKRTIAVMTFIFVLLIFFVPIIINIMYPPHNIMVSVWEPGEYLSYFGTIVMGGATVFLGIQANNMNKRMLDYEKIPYKAFVNILLDKCELKEVKDAFNGYILDVELENITKVPIVGAIAKNSNIIGIDGDWNDKNSTTSRVFSIDGIQTLDINNGYVKIHHVIKDEDLMDHVFSIKMELTNIYGHKTEQYINVVFMNKKLIEVKTREA